MHTWHDGYHGHWEKEMLFNIAEDPHEQDNLAGNEFSLANEGADILRNWTAEQLGRSFSPVDPMEIVLDEGGPFHIRGHLPSYLERLRETDRAHWAEVLQERHPEAADYG